MYIEKIYQNNVKGWLLDAGLMVIMKLKKKNHLKLFYKSFQ